MRSIYTTALNTHQLPGQMSGKSVRGFKSLYCFNSLNLSTSRQVTVISRDAAAEPGREPKQGL
jgi:hypothetical protein